MAKKLESLIKQLTKDALKNLTDEHRLTAIPSSATQVNRTITPSCSCAWIGSAKRAGRDARDQWEAHLGEKAG